MIKIYLLALLPLFLIAGEPGVTDDAAWAQIRKTYLEKPRRVMLDNDGCDAVNFPVGKTPTIENFYAEMLDKMPGNEFDVLVYCPGTVGFAVLNRTAVGDRQLGTINPGELLNITRILDEKFNTDPLELARKFAGRHGYEFVVNMRINDIHDISYPEWLPQWKKDHPEYLCGIGYEKTAYDFAHQAVRDHFSAYIKEWIDNYSPNGIMIDFLRAPILFKSYAEGKTVSQKEKDDFTRMLEDLRAYAEKAGRRRGVPIYFAFRLPDSVTVCQTIGADVEKWAQKGLFDIFIAGGDQGRFEPWEKTAEFCRRHGLKFYASVDHSFLNAGGDFNRNSNAAFNGDIAAAYAGKADGIYLFNMFYQSQYFPYVRRDLQELKYQEKTYFVSRHGNMPFPLHVKKGLPALHPGEPLFLAAEKSSELLIEIGDNFAQQAGTEGEAKAYLQLETQLLPENLEVQINDLVLKDAIVKNGSIVFPVPVSSLQPGINRIKLTLSNAKSVTQTLLVGDTLLAGANQAPWRRLFPGNGTRGAETIADGAYVLTSSGNGAVNFLTSMPGLQGGGLKVGFELKVKSGSEPETSVLRIANGQNVEVVDFRPGEIRYKFSGKTVRFNTSDRFHRYEVELTDGALAVSADGKLLLKSTVPANAENPAIKLQGYHLELPAMQQTGLLFGGLSAAGKGSGAWKNLELTSPVGKITDLALSINWSSVFSEKLLTLGQAAPEWNIELDFGKGKIPAHPIFGNGYQASTLIPQGAGLLLDNDLNDGAMMDLNALPAFKQPNRYMIVDWEVAPLRAPRQPDHQNFQMVLRPPRLENRGHYEFMIRSAEGEITTSWGRVQVPPGAQKLRAVIDLATGEAGVFLDGKPLTSGKAGTENHGEGMFWGDYSSSISGSAILKYVRVAMNK